MKKEQSIEKINTYIGEKIKKNKEAIESTKKEEIRATKELEIMNEKLNEFKINVEDLPSSSAIKKYKEIRKNLKKNKAKLEKIIEKLKKNQNRYEKKSQRLESKKMMDINVSKKEKKEKKEAIGNKQILLLRKFNQANLGFSITEPRYLALNNRGDLEKYITETKGVEATKQFKEFLNKEELQDIGEKRDEKLEDIDKQYGKTIVSLAYLMASVERMKKKIDEAEADELKEALRISLEGTEKDINKYSDEQKDKAQEVIGLLRDEGIEI